MELKYYTILTSPLYNNPSLLVNDWNKENYPFGFGGLNHDGTECIWAEEQEVYLKKDVDEAIAELKAKLDKAIAELEGERRWRKFSEESPKDKQWIFVFVENPSKYGTYIELRRWDMGCKFDVEEQELYELWMPLPSAPKEADK